MAVTDSSLGLFTAESLEEAVKAAPKEFLVEGLLFKGSINLAVGASGLGKTALLASLGIAVAAGIPWLGRKTMQGPVLFVDGESPMPAFLTMLQSLSAHAGLSRIPENLHVYSPNWDPRSPDKIGLHPSDNIAKAVMEKKPVLVLVDPLRVFWSDAESKPESTIKMLKEQRRLSTATGATWVTLHHRRKTSVLNPVNLETDPQGWFQEAAGAHALVNQTDTRLGIDVSANPKADLVVSGFTRLLGAVPPLHIQRTFDEAGEPLGYQLLGGHEQLTDKQRSALDSLMSEFRFTDARKAIGGSSDAATVTFLKACESAGLLTSTGAGRSKRYHKKAPQLALVQKAS